MASFNGSKGDHCPQTLKLLPSLKPNDSSSRLLLVPIEGNQSTMQPLLGKLDIFAFEKLGTPLNIVITSSIAGLNDSSLFMQAAAAWTIRDILFKFLRVNFTRGSIKLSVAPCCNSGFACQKCENQIQCFCPFRIIIRAKNVISKSRWKVVSEIRRAHWMVWLKPFSWVREMEMTWGNTIKIWFHQSRVFVVVNYQQNVLQ